MVMVAVVAGMMAALTVVPPSEIPAFALQAVAVYRVEVGAAVFLGLYLATMALVLAMHNRGYAEIGTGGIKAQGVAGVSADEFVMDLLAELADEIDDLEIRVEERSDVR